MSNPHDDTITPWPERVWGDSPADLAEAAAWDVRTPWGSLSRDQVASAPGPAIYAVVAVTTVALGLLVSWRGEVHESAAGFWPPAGVALLALVMVPMRRWAWVVAAIATPTVIGLVTGVAPVDTVLWWGAGNIVEPLFSASVVLWFAWSRWMTRFRLFVVFFAVGVIVGPMVGATIGSIGTVISYDEPWFEVWLHWVITDGLGVLIVAPMVGALTPYKPAHRSRPGSEIAALVLLIAIVSGLAFADIGADGATFLPYLMLVGLVWAGIRFSTQAVAVAGFVVALSANLAISLDMGPFAESSTATASLTLPIFLMIAVGTALMVALLASDMADRDEVHGLLTHRVTHDHLTGLPNRMLFANRLERALGGVGAEDLAVLVIDLDDFKKINDRHGHPAGDAVIREVAARLEATLPEDVLLARFGADEFAVMVHHGRKGVGDIARLVEDLAAVFDRPFSVDSGEWYTMSCGIGVVLATEARAETSTDVLRCADIALNQAKSSDSSIAFYDEVLEARTQRRLEVAQEFEGAVERGEISLVYQAQVSLRSGRVKEFEALARWDNRRFGSIAPDEFVVIAERGGLIGPFGDFVLEEACRQLAEWRSEHPAAADLRVAVNVSARQLCDMTFPDRTAAILARTELPADALTLEITETAVMDDLEVTAQVLRQLRRLGVRLAMDDFGTGYSSLTNLRLVELDTLKIDRSFIDGLGDLVQETAIVRSIIGLAHSFGLTVVAEGVETDQQVIELMRLGCDEGQGYLWCRPVAPDEAAALIDTPLRLPTAERSPVR